MQSQLQIFGANGRLGMLAALACLTLAGVFISANVPLYGGRSAAENSMPVTSVGTQKLFRQSAELPTEWCRRRFW